MKYKEIKKLIESLKKELALSEDAPIQVLPPEEPKEVSYETPAVYATMEKIEPKNLKVKAAYADKAVQGSTSFVFVIEEMDRNDGEFHGRAAIVCKHMGKLVYAGVSFPQKAKSAIPPNLYKMIPVRGASMPSWVKPYIDTSIHQTDEQ